MSSLVPIIGHQLSSSSKEAPDDPIELFVHIWYKWWLLVTRVNVENKAGYKTTLVACRWAGRQHPINLRRKKDSGKIRVKHKKVKGERMEGRTDLAM